MVATNLWSLSECSVSSLFKSRQAVPLAGIGMEMNQFLEERDSIWGDAISYCQRDKDVIMEYRFAVVFPLTSISCN